MLIALATNIALRGQFPFNSLLLGQVLFYGLAGLGAVVRLKPKILRLPFYFCMINSALFGWVYQALRYRRAIPSRVELDQVENRPPSCYTGRMAKDLFFLRGWNHRWNRKLLYSLLWIGSPL